MPVKATILTSLTHTYQIVMHIRPDQVVLQYAHTEWSSIMSPGLLITGLPSLRSQQGVVQEETLPYTTTTNPYYFPLVIVPVLHVCLRLYTKVGKSTLPVTLPFRYHTRLPSS